MFPSQITYASLFLSDVILMVVLSFYDFTLSFVKVLLKIGGIATLLK